MPKTNSTAKKGRVSKPALAAIIATVLLMIFIVVALLLEPVEAIPEFNITDQGGEWKAQGTIAVFDDTIQPKSEGTYKFIIKSECTEVLEYGFRLSEYINADNIDNVNPFMQYRLKVDNLYLGDGDWHYVGMNYNGIEILPGTEHLMTLEWRWPFEIDDEHDKNDTLIGRAGGKLSVEIFIWAEVVVEEIW